MREALLVVVGIVVLLATASLEPATAIRGGLVVSVVFLVLGSIAGGLYHHRLYHCLHARGALPKRWWIEPTKLHRDLTEDERDRTLPSFYVGAAAFGVCVLGCVAMLSGAVRIAL
jgi:hypothetical protein